VLPNRLDHAAGSHTWHTPLTYEQVCTRDSRACRLRWRSSTLACPAARRPCQLGVRPTWQRGGPMVKLAQQVAHERLARPPADEHRLRQPREPACGSRHLLLSDPGSAERPGQSADECQGAQQCTWVSSRSICHKLGEHLRAAGVVHGELLQRRDKHVGCLAAFGAHTRSERRPAAPRPRRAHAAAAVCERCLPHRRH